VREAVEQGIGGVLAAKKRLDEVYAEYAEPDADFDKLAAEQAELEAIIAAAGSENTDLQLELAADALRLPPWDAVIGVLSGGEKRRVALCRLLLSKPDMLLLDEPTNHLDAESVEWLEHFLQRFPGTVVAITHDRYFLDNAAEWILELDRGSRHPLEGQLLRLAGPEGKAPGGRAEEGRRAHAKAMKEELKWVRSERQGPPGQEQGAPGALRGAERRRIPEAQRDQRDLHPGGRAPGQRGDRVQGRQQELRRPAADRQPELQGAGRAPSSASSAPTAPASRRCSA
jgi:ATPase subunit of ABC transporter with duplicated ATPase domains